MKTVSTVGRVSLFALAIAALGFMSSCGGGGGGPEKPDVAAMLKSGQWKVQTVTVGGANQISLFTGLTVTFSASSFSASNGGPVWPSSGTWTLNTAGTIITRGDGLTVTIDNISETSLKVSLDWDQTTLGGGRIESIEGSHVFTFGK